MIIKTNSSILSLFCIIISLNGCFGQNDNDPDLIKPDTDNSGLQKGYNYTDLGILVASPWRLSGEKKDSLTKTDLSRFRNNITNHQKANLIFELHKNGSAKYWFMEDYIERPIDSIRNSNGTTTIIHKVRRSKDLKLKNIYSDAKWTYSKTDSIFEINFGGENAFGLTPIKGKIYELSTDMFCIVTSFDNKSSNSMEAFTVTTCFSHY